MLNLSTILNQLQNDPRVANNAMAQNVFAMRQNHDSQGLKNMMGNICKSNGLDYDKVIETTKRQFGIK